MDNDATTASNPRWLWCSARHGVIGTHCRAEPGYPFGSVVPFVLGRDGLPLLLLSPLSQHTRNLDQDPRCSLTLLEEGVGDVQQRPRLTALGNVERCQPGADAHRYFRYFPQAEGHHSELGFVFYRFAARTLHWNGGFATARWLGTDRLIRANPLDAAAEERIVEHMNADHRNALKTYLTQSGQRPQSPASTISMVGIDAEGLDIRFDEAIVRVALATPIDSAGRARQVLVAMAQANDRAD